MLRTIHLQMWTTNFGNVQRKWYVIHYGEYLVLISRINNITCRLKGVPGEFMVAPLLKSLYAS